MQKTSMKSVFLGWLSLSMFFLACDADSRFSGVSDKGFSQTRHMVGEARPTEHIRVTGFGPVTPSGNPLKDALGLLQLSENDLTRRPAYEEGYIMLAQLPLIDHLSRSPFGLQRWADEISHDLQNSASKSLDDTLAVIVDVLGGSVSGDHVFENQRQCNVDTLEAYRYLFKTFGQAPGTSELKYLKEAGFTPGFDRCLGALIHGFADAAKIAIEAYSDLSPQEIDFLTSSPQRFFYPHGSQFNFLTASTHTQVEVVAIVRKIKFDRLFDAFSQLAAALDTFAHYLSGGSQGTSPVPRFYRDDQIRSGTVLSLPSPVGDIVILGQDDNNFHGSAALIVDLGGNDRYTGSIGSGQTQTGRVSILVDIAGNDTYGDQKERLTQGVGVASIGILADLAGDDHYIAGDMSQGCGIYGIGVQLDSHGNDIYEMGLMGQGFGVFGVGLLADRKGSDRYVISGMGQGVGSTMGFGGLIDSDGDDDYRAEWHPEKGALRPDNWSHAQGVGISIRSPDWRREFSLYGGVGFLSDGAGNDTYYCSGGNCMGAGYFMSVGSLVDHSGNDRYVPKNGNGMGFAVHLASGILIDKDGNDQYIAKKDSGGVGADRSIGLLADYQGNDLYGPFLSTTAVTANEGDRGADADQSVYFKSTENDLAVSSYASASRSRGLGLLLDYNGDDRYFAQRGIRSASCGAVVPPPDPHNWSHALLIDLGGTDAYFPTDRQNNSYQIDLDHGLSYDVDLHGYKNTNGENAPETTGDSHASLTLQAASLPTPITEELYQLAGKDNYDRFESVGRLMRSKPVIIDAIIDTLKSSLDEKLNRSLVEVLNHFILQKEMNRSRAQNFESLLKARDRDIRIYAARTLGWWGVSSSAEAMIRNVNDSDPVVRSHVIWAIGMLGRLEDLKILREATLFETSQRCKREATRAFSEILSKNRIDDITSRREVQETLLMWMGDPDPILRRDAAMGLRFIGPGTAGIQALINSLKDDDVYVKRASAKSLAFLGQKEGIPVLIDTLTFPSIDTAEHYDQELVKDLAFFCGTDFPGETRYEHKHWKEWWARNGHAVDINENLAIMRKIEAAFTQEDENEGLRILDELQAEHPKNTVIKFRYKRYCQDWITYRLLTQESINRNTLERCLRLQKKIVGIEPGDPQARTTLAGFYARLSRFDEAVTTMEIAAKLDPDNPAYEKTLMHYQTLRGSRLPGN
ncbi:MAG: HEAT repeat domain-containing protein [Desulfobacterales bacterium]